MEEILQELRFLCEAGKIAWTRHALTRMLQRDITRGEVKAAVMRGRIIEEYPQDYPYPAVLLLHVLESPCTLCAALGTAAVDYHCVQAGPKGGKRIRDQKGEFAMKCFCARASWRNSSPIL